MFAKEWITQHHLSHLYTIGPIYRRSYPFHYSIFTRIQPFHPVVD